MQLKGRVTRFSEFAGSGLAITKAGIISFSCVARVDSGHDPKVGDVLYLEIPNPDAGELESIVEAVAWALSQEALEIALTFQKRQGRRNTEAGSISVMQHYEKGSHFTDEGMSEEARYLWYLENIARAVALQELESISKTELKEMMAHIAAFEVKHPKKSEHIRKQVNRIIANC